MIIANKNVRIVSRVSETEKKKIESLADKCGLSISEYVRKRALGYEPKDRIEITSFPLSFELSIPSSTQIRLQP